MRDKRLQPKKRIGSYMKKLDCFLKDIVKKKFPHYITIEK